MKQNQLCHQGVVVSSTPQMISVQVVTQAACTSCDAKSACNFIEMEKRIIEVPNKTGQDISPGSHVVVAISQTLGLKAVLLVYLAPFLLVVLGLFTLTAVTGSELISGLFSLALLLPYYGILFLFKNRLKKEFRFEIRSP